MEASLLLLYPIVILQSSRLAESHLFGQLVAGDPDGARASALYLSLMYPGAREILLNRQSDHPDIVEPYPSRRDIDLVTNELSTSPQLYQHGHRRSRHRQAEIRHELDLLLLRA